MEILWHALISTTVSLNWVLCKTRNDRIFTIVSLSLRATYTRYFSLMCMLTMSFPSELNLHNQSTVHIQQLTTMVDNVKIFNNRSFKNGKRSIGGQILSFGCTNICWCRYLGLISNAYHAEATTLIFISLIWSYLLKLCISSRGHMKVCHLRGDWEYHLSHFFIVK